MDLQKNRLEILKFISDKERTPTEISKKFNMSLPGVHSNLNFLENRGFIEKSGEKKGKTRPYNLYTIKKDIFSYLKISKKDVSKETLEIDEDFDSILQIYKISSRDFRKSLLKFWYDIQRFRKEIQSIAVYGSVAKGNQKQDSDIDILIISKNPDKLEKEYSAKMFENKMIMAKAFSKKDFLDSKNKGSLFIKEILENMFIIYDPENILSSLKNGNQ